MLSVRWVWQIVNRDLSIAVLRSFVEVRREEAGQAGPGSPRRNRSLAAPLPGARLRTVQGQRHPLEQGLRPREEAQASRADPEDEGTRNGESAPKSDAGTEARANGNPAPHGAGSRPFKPLRILEVCGMACGPTFQRTSALAPADPLLCATTWRTCEVCTEGHPGNCSLILALHT